MSTSGAADLWPPARGEGSDDTSITETEEEQSSLIPLLQQIPLADLREIARQRGWRVKGTSKADYVPALASLLSDPTETARAVTELPENLREGLRAAFVADDGSGITATIMAQTMTALRGAAGPTIKPVEAAAVLSDLARWGLVLQWRESLYGEGRHVLPWQVQRLIPPLPGWCPPSPEAPATPTPHRDAPQVVNSLCAIWKTIAAKEPVVRPPLPPQGDAVRPRSGHVPLRSPSFAPGLRPEQMPGGIARRVAPSPQTTRDEVPTSLATNGDERRSDEADLSRRAGSRGPTETAQPEREAKAPEGEIPAEILAGRRWASVAQGWPYDPLELRGWAGNGRRAGTATRTLSVPRTPFLVDDAALASLARLIEGDGQSLAVGDDHSLAAGDGQSLAAGDGEESEFLCRLLCELDLVSIQSGHLSSQQKEMARFLQLAVPEQHRTIAQAYLSLLDWSELDLLLRQDARLVLWHRPYFALPYDQFRSMLLRIRHVLLRFLACAGEDNWCRLSDVEAALRTLWPHFVAPLQSERQPWLAQACGLAWRQERGQPDPAQAVLPSGDESGTPRHSADPAEAAGRSPAKRAGCSSDSASAGATTERKDGEPASWEASQGAFLRVMLEGPLYWLGFVELSYSSGQLSAFRLHGLANWIWGRLPARFDIEGEHAGKALTIDEGGRTISMQPGSVPPQAHVFLGRIARLEEASPERFVYRLQPQTALAAFESGASLTDLLAEWERVMGQPIPATVRETLSESWTRYGQVRLYEGFSLLELSDEVTLRELEASTSLNQHIVARLSPRLVLVPDEAVEALMREFAAKDYMPKQVE